MTLSALRDGMSFSTGLVRDNSKYVNHNPQKNVIYLFFIFSQSNICACCLKKEKKTFRTPTFAVPTIYPFKLKLKDSKIL